MVVEGVSAGHHLCHRRAELGPALGSDGSGLAEEAVRGDELNVVEVGYRAVAYALGSANGDLGRQSPYGRGDGCDQHAPKAACDAGSSQDHDRADLVEIGPPHLGVTEI